MQIKRDYAHAYEWLLTASLLLCLLLALLVSGCASKPTQAISSRFFYQRDMVLRVNGETMTGAGVPRRADQYDITVWTKHDMDFFLATSCHRQVKIERAGQSAAFSSLTSLRFVYRPDSQMEASGACPLQLSASAESNEHSWAFLEFETPGETLPSIVKCDGGSKQYGGVSVCQARAGLLQNIQFWEPVISSFEKGCEMKPSADKMNWFYEMPVGRCTFVFASREGKFHRHSTVGYDQLFVRGGK